MRLITGLESAQVQLRLTFFFSFHPLPVSCAALEMTHLTSPGQYKVIRLNTQSKYGHTISKLIMCSN